VYALYIHKFLVGKNEEERILSKTRHRWESNVNMGLKEIGYSPCNELIWLRIVKSGGLF
jgi:hypothetical protein